MVEVTRLPETAIPSWAFLDVTIADTFNTTAALADGGKSFKHTNSSYLKVGHTFLRRGIRVIIRRRIYTLEIVFNEPGRFEPVDPPCRNDV